MEGETGEAVGARDGPILRDKRRYYCDYCGISRSKKSLITSHILTHHKEEMDNVRDDDEDEKVKGKNLYCCEQCNAAFKKPAHLKQHMRAHSPEKPFNCPVGDCPSRYKRKDHLSRHLLKHQGKLFKCPIENCNHEFAYQGNMKRHMKEIHEHRPSTDIGQKQYVCQEIRCGKVFKFASKLQKHKDSHVKLESNEAYCAEPGCGKKFTNVHCLKAHVKSIHQHMTCDLCGTKQLRKNIKRHLRTHEEGGSSERIKCEFEGCLHTFSTKSNLRQHEKAVHHEIRPFRCCYYSSCGMRFAYKHVKDKHEKSGCHVYTPGDFVESDEQFQSRPRGGRKRTYPNVEMLIRKRITPPNQSDPIMDQGPEYLHGCAHQRPRASS